MLGRAESALFGKTAGEIRTVMPVQAVGLFKGWERERGSGRRRRMWNKAESKPDSSRFRKVHLIG